MTGKQLFEQLSVRNDEYAQFLQSVFFNIGDALFPLLEKAEQSGKKLSLSDDFNGDEIISSDIVMV